MKYERLRSLNRNLKLIINIDGAMKFLPPEMMKSKFPVVSSTPLIDPYSSETQGKNVLRSLMIAT